MKFYIFALLGAISALSLEKHPHVAHVEQKRIKHDDDSGLALWKKLDSDGDGKLTKKEAHEAIKDLDASKSEKKLLHITIELVWEKADKDKSGDLSKEEFLESWKNDVVTPGSVIEKCKTKGSDELTKEQAVKCMANNLKGADEKWRDKGKRWMEKLFDKLDEDHDGKLTKKEIEEGIKKLAAEDAKDDEKYENKKKNKK